MIEVSVILCTYNRSGSLAHALESIAACSMPSSVEWEVLVVDNNSKDDTRTVTEEFCRRYPGRFRYIFEPRQGLSQARNRGIQEAQGEIVAFVDDDVIVEPAWLDNLTSPLRSGEWAGSGGRILPERDFVPPRWLALEGPFNLLGAVCAYFDLGDSPYELKTPAYGANMAFRRSMFEKYGVFRTDLGRTSNNLIGHEDTEFGRRLIDGGERLCYVPLSVVFHEINEKRVCKKFLLAWWYGFGRSSVRESKENLTVFQAFKIFCRAILTTAQWLLSLDPQRRFYSKCRTWFAAGKLIEAYRQARVSGCEIKRQPESI